MKRRLKVGVLRPVQIALYPAPMKRRLKVVTLTIPLTTSLKAPMKRRLKEFVFACIYIELIAGSDEKEIERSQAL